MPPSSLPLNIALASLAPLMVIVTKNVTHTISLPVDVLRILRMILPKHLGFRSQVVAATLWVGGADVLWDGSAGVGGGGVGDVGIGRGRHVDLFAGLI